MFRALILLSVVVECGALYSASLVERGSLDFFALIGLAFVWGGIAVLANGTIRVLEPVDAD